VYGCVKRRVRIGKLVECLDPPIANCDGVRVCTLAERLGGAVVL